MIRPVALFGFLFALAGPAAALERILDFDSDITVREDGSMHVIETISVRAEGTQIKRGIYRDFPTNYKDRHGHQVMVKFELTAVSRDGVPEQYHTEALANGVRIYIGQKDHLLRVPSEYTYQLEYETDRQLGFFDQHDELYWNVTGTGWAFSIDRASASVNLPSTVNSGDLELDGYTGPQGATGRSYRSEVDARGRARFETTTALPAHNGLTIVVMWPKGHVREPGAVQELGYLLTDNLEVLIGSIGLLLLLGYYGHSWRRVGRDPEAGTIYPRYAPPTGFSPASMRYVSRMGYDNKTFATALVNLGVNGHIKIDEDDDDYTLERNKANATDLAPGESVILNDLFKRSDTAVLKQSNHKQIRAALKGHKDSLAADYEKIYFNKNRKYVYAGIAASVVLVLAMFLTRPGEQAMVSLFLLAWLTGWSFAVGVLGLRVVRSFRSRKGIAGTLGAVFALAFALPFFIGEFVGLGILFYHSSLAAIMVLAAIVITNIGFFHWMKAPTRAGRAILDEIEGFKMYLGVAEKERLQQMKGPEQTPELFEEYLPFAMALDVEQAWAEKFTTVLAKAQESREGGYHPAWYSGRSWNAGAAPRFASALGGSLAATIASSATAPGSSSGGSGGGGGFSGGGGGGGGGGGW